MLEFSFIFRLNNKVKLIHVPPFELSSLYLNLRPVIRRQYFEPVALAAAQLLISARAI
jgi:hypothetical protein